MKSKIFPRLLLLLLLVIGIVLIFHFHLINYFTLSSLKKYHLVWHAWSKQHYVLSVLVYMLVYILAMTFSVPGATVLTLTGGLLFGPIAIIYVLISATTGATILFLIVRTALGEYLASQASGWVVQMEKGFQKNALNYILALRLIPLFPFWAVNIAAGLLAVKLRTFVLATFFGIVPASIIFVLLGNSLNQFFVNEQSPSLNILFQPSIFLPLVGLAFLALFPVVLRRRKNKKG